MRILKEGDTGRAIFEMCRRQVTTTYRYQTLRLEKTGVDVESVLVGVCDECGRVVSVPAQSTPKLAEARRSKETTLNARVPEHLVDVVRLLAHRFEVPFSAFSPMLLRFYLREVSNKPAFARRIGRLAAGDLAKGRPGSRITLRVDEDLLTRAMKSAADNAGLGSRTDLVKAVIVAAKEDALDGYAKGRTRSLEAIAAATA